MITYAQARTIVEHALDHARSSQFPPMTVAVLDAGGHLVAFGREDHSSLLRERIAVGKARGALNMGVGSRSLAVRAASHPHFVNALVGLADGDLVPVPGGVLVRDGDGQVVGAVGVSGHLPGLDEEAALKGIEATGLTADPGSDTPAHGDGQHTAGGKENGTP
ncbi:heme-binding protein [Streptomyces sp. GMY02]|uniref:GlcG/HbpS family heme-binding protein n=1 Tax=Streptomyces sp. GMY02 TaxID=1333528 RepID=UPI001C2C8F42|nr:heme-binding protein [Streptomyces sp. GMY02]QXE33259.1 heme-binding protein [Streptomyces sp. GMY02]